MDTHNAEPFWRVPDVFLYHEVCNQDHVLPIAPRSGATLSNGLRPHCNRPSSLGVFAELDPHLVVCHIPGTCHAAECRVAHVS